jgi:uncharacterized protein (TIGR03437 family)
MYQRFAHISLLFILSTPTVVAQTAANWTQQMPQTSPAARYNAVLAYDAAFSRVLLFGGTTNTTALADTWLWNGTNWASIPTSNNPPVDSAQPAIAYDAARSQVVVFAVDGSTWVWNGSTWTQKSPQTSPPARIYAAMAYDSVHSRTVLFGGESVAGAFDDTWLWDGTNWTQQSPAMSPPGRYEHSMAFDTAHGQVVLFGGYTYINDTLFNDTWVWDGANWTQKSPQTSPPGVAQFAMAYDTAHSQVVVFGSGLNETWVWDGTNWTMEMPLSSPSARSGMSMAYDSAHGQMVLFGGVYDFNQVFGDTWTWTGAGGAPPPPSGPTITSVISASGFGGFSTVAPGSWVEIYGSNLAPDTRQWAGSDFSGNNAPTTLDGVQVTIGGQKAFVEYISSSPAQINAQLPSNIPTGGPLPVTVTNGTQTSGAFNVTVNSTMPGLLAPASFLIGGKQYVVALLSDNVTYVLPTGAIAGVASRPAKPGETIVLYGVGFGGVTPSIPAGQIVGQSNQLAASFQISFGGTPAQAVPYAGLAPGYVGLYQFDVVVPAVADNDLVPVTFALGGTAGTQTLYIAVHQ